MWVEAKWLGEQFRRRLTLFRPPMEKKYAATAQKSFMPATAKSLAQKVDRKQGLVCTIISISRC